MPERAVVTGGAGFVGSVLARKLVTLGYDVHVWLRPGSDPWRLATLDTRKDFVDLTDSGSVSAAMTRARPDYVFHLAAHGSYPSQVDWRRMVETNVLGTMNLVHAALAQNVGTIVNTGSSSEYGLVDHPPPESARAEPNSTYAASKLSQTTFCRLISREHGIHIPTLRLYSVYGPYEEPSRLMPTLITHGLAGKLPKLVSPTTARDFVYVDDVADAFLRAARTETEEPGAIFNVGTGRQTTIGEVVAIARNVLAIEAEPMWSSMPAREWDTTVWVADPRKIESSLGWSASVDFEAGFKRFASWLEREGPPLGVYS